MLARGDCMVPLRRKAVTQLRVGAHGPQGIDAFAVGALDFNVTHIDVAKGQSTATVATTNGLQAVLGYGNCIGHITMWGFFCVIC